MKTSMGMIFEKTEKGNTNESTSYYGVGHYKVGPFVVVNRVSIDEMKLIDYIMNEDLDDRYAKTYR